MHTTCSLLTVISKHRYVENRYIRAYGCIVNPQVYLKWISHNNISCTRCRWCNKNNNIKIWQTRIWIILWHFYYYCCCCFCFCCAKIEISIAAMPRLGVGEGVGNITFRVYFLRVLPPPLAHWNTHRTMILVGTYCFQRCITRQTFKMLWQS